MEIERVRRPFWIHQCVEYALGIALISASVQMLTPTVPALMGLLIIINAAVAKGSAGAFRLVGRRLHRVLDLVVIGVLVGFALQPWISVDNTSRLMVGAVAFIMWFVWFHTDFSERASREERKRAKAAARAAAPPRDSAEIGRQAGRVVGGTMHSVKRWKEGLGGADESEPTTTPSNDPAPAQSPPASAWDPPRAAQ